MHVGIGRMMAGLCGPVFMDEGVVMEAGPPREVLANPRHPRTQAFLSKVL